MTKLTSNERDINGIIVSKERVGADNTFSDIDKVIAENTLKNVEQYRALHDELIIKYTKENDSKLQEVMLNSILDLKYVIKNLVDSVHGYLPLCTYSLHVDRLDNVTYNQENEMLLSSVKHMDIVLTGACILKRHHHRLLAIMYDELIEKVCKVCDCLPSLGTKFMNDMYGNIHVDVRIAIYSIIESIATYAENHSVNYSDEIMFKLSNIRNVQSEMWHGMNLMDLGIPHLDSI